MMEKIRTAANHIVVKIIFALIILSFIFAGVGGIFGGDSSSRDEQQYIAKVDGEGISRAAFERYASAAIQNSGNVMGDDFILAIRRGVLQEQIDNVIAYDLANKLNVKISHDAIKNYICQQTIFFEDGEFSNARYLQLLTANGYTGTQYAMSLKTDLERSQLEMALVDSDFVLPVDSNISVLRGEKRMAYLGQISSDIVTNIEEPSDELALEYYQQNEKSFTNLSEMFKLKVMILSKELIKSTINTDEQELKQYYQDNIAQYTSPTKYSFSIIEIDDLDSANNIYQRLSAGENFESIAVELAKLPIQLKNKGFLGWFTQDELPEILVQANLNKKGTFSEPLNKDGSYFIVKLNDIDNTKQMSFDTVRAVVKSDFVLSSLDRQTENIEDTVAKLITDGRSLTEIEEKLKVDLSPYVNTYETSWLNFSLSFLKNPEMQNAILDSHAIDDPNRENVVIGPVYVADESSVYVFNILDYRTAGLQSFETVKSEILEMLKQKIALTKFKEVGLALVDDLNKGTPDSFDRVQFSKRELITRDSTNHDKAIIDMVFSIVPEFAPHGISFDSDKLATVAALTDVEYAERSDISDQLRMEIKQNTFLYLKSDLRSKAKIEIMPNANM